MPETLRTLQDVLPDAVWNAGDFLSAPQDIERALVPVYIFDPERLTILAANAAAQRLYGYTEEEFRRLTLLDIRPAEEAERTRRFLGGGRPEGLWYSGVWRHRAKSGRVFAVNAMGLSIRREGRQAILAIITDLTQTLHALGTSVEAGYMLFPFAEKMSEAYWLRSTADGRLIYLNPAFMRVFGLTRETGYADYEAVERLILPEDIDAFQRYRNDQASGPAALEFRIRRPDGLVRWISSRCFPLEDATGERLVAGISEDITERKQAEQRRIEAIEAQRDALVREVHHRIKNSLQGVTGLLRQFAVAHPDLAPHLAAAAGQVQSVAMVHGLQGRSSSGRVELCDLVRNVAASVETLMQTRIAADVPSECDPCLLIVESDAVPVALVLNELVFNAAKHGAGGKTVRVAVSVVAAGDGAEVRIVNPGHLPPGFAGLRQLGNGLQLVGLLLPSQGASLAWREQDGEVTATLSLCQPVILPHSRPS